MNCNTERLARKGIEISKYVVKVKVERQEIILNSKRTVFNQLVQQQKLDLTRIAITFILILQSRSLSKTS